MRSLAGPQRAVTAMGATSGCQSALKSASLAVIAPLAGARRVRKAARDVPEDVPGGFVITETTEAL